MVSRPLAAPSTRCSRPSQTGGSVDLDIRACCASETLPGGPMVKVFCNCRAPHSNLHVLQVDVWQPLQEVAEKCWVVWELMVLAQPLMVIAPSPGNTLYCLPLPQARGRGYLVNGSCLWLPWQFSGPSHHVQGCCQSNSSLLNPVDSWVIQAFPLYVWDSNPSY